MSTNEEIRSLCHCVLQAEDIEEFDSAISKLKTALAEHALETENLAIHLVLNSHKQKVG